MKINRLIAILLLMESRGMISAGELAQALEVSKRTIHRDIEELCQAGVPIAANTGQCGGYYLMNGYASNLKSLNADEVVSLYLSGMGVQPQRHTQSSISLQNALFKLEKLLSGTYAKDIALVRKRFFFDSETWWNHTDIGCLELLRKAVLQSRKLRLLYRTTSMGNNSVGWRVVCPYGLVVKHSQWYLAAFCESRAGIRTFKCDRIAECEILDDRFVVPDDFDLECYWHTNESAFKQMVSMIPGYPVKLRLIGGFKLPDGLEILESAGDMARINLHSLETAVQTVWAMGANVAVEEPEDLMHELKGMADRVAGLY